MLAVAKREVVTERIDSLLKIGLGSLGKVCLLLILPFRLLSIDLFRS
jgi:hypothetical protein